MHLRLPVAWLTEIDQSAALLLAHILSLWVARQTGGLRMTPEADLKPQEVIVRYKEVADHLHLSVRTVNRAMKKLVETSAVTKRRADRANNRELDHNTVILQPNWKNVATLSGCRGHDISAFWQVNGPVGREELSSRSSPSPVQGDDPFGEGEDRLGATYKAYFQHVFGKPYRCSTAQEKVDQAAATALGLPKWRAPDQKYCVWARAYIDARKENAVNNRGREFRIDAIRNDGFVRSACSYDAFIAWVTSDDPLPNGRYRRNFDSRKPRPEHLAPPRRPI